MAPDELERMADSAIAGAGGPVVDVGMDVDDEASARGARDEALIDALFVVAAAMSKQPPPIVSLRGDLPDDLSDGEIADAWTEAGLGVGAAADKNAFKRAWLALDQLYDDDLMVEARRPPKKTRAPDS